MTGYSSNMNGDSVRKSGSTQPYPSGEAGRNPGQGAGAVPTVGFGQNTPVIIPTGATNNGRRLPSRGGQP